MKNSRLSTLAALLFAAASPMLSQGAQNAATDAHWQAWLGCWTPASTLIRVIGKSQTNMVCVLPGATATSVDLLTVADGKIVDRNHLDADGRQHSLAKDGCSGWQSAKWSPSGHRVYIKSEFDCKGAPATKVSALYAMAGSGQWINVQSVRVDKNSGVHAVRYREENAPGPLPAEITDKLPTRNASSLANTAAMLAASSQLTFADIEEASHELDANVVSTWLIETDKLTTEKPKTLTGKELVQLADNGVPSSVIDVMLAIAYPNELAVNPSTNGIARQGSDSAYLQYRDVGLISRMNPIIGFDRFGNPIYAADVSMLSNCSPFGYGPYDIGWSSLFSCSRFGYNGLYNGFGAYGYGPYGYPGYYGGYNGGYYGGGYYGGVPIVVPQGSGGAAAPHGKVVNGRGYSQGTSGSSGSGSTAQPSNSTEPAGSGSGSASSGSSSAPPPPPRTAQPRKP